MAKENTSQEYRLENIDETRNCFLEEIKQNELMSRKHKNVFTTLLQLLDMFPFLIFLLKLLFQ